MFQVHTAATSKTLYKGSIEQVSQVFIKGLLTRLGVRSSDVDRWAAPLRTTFRKQTSLFLRPLELHTGTRNKTASTNTDIQSQYSRFMNACTKCSKHLLLQRAQSTHVHDSISSSLARTTLHHSAFWAGVSSDPLANTLGNSDLPQDVQDWQVLRLKTLL